MKRISVVLLLLVLLAACSQSKPNALPSETETPLLEPLALFAPKQKLTGLGRLRDNFGISVAFNGKTMVVGCTCGTTDIGYVFEKDSLGVWKWIKTLRTPKIGYVNAYASVALSGDTIVASVRDYGSYDSLVYVFERNQGGTNKWGLVKQLTPSDNVPGDAFGYFVYMDGDTIVAAAPGFFSGDTADYGSAYIFQRNQGGANKWGQAKKLLDSGGIAAIQKDTIVVLFNTGLIGTRGVARILQRNQGGTNQWGLVQEVTADFPDQDLIGPVALDGNTMAIPSRPQGGLGSAALHIFYFKNSINQWKQAKKLSFTDRGAAGLAVSGDTLLMRYNNSSNKPAIDVLQRNIGGSNNWGRTQTIVPPQDVEDEFLSYNTLTLSGGTVVVGFPYDDSIKYQDEGSVYVFR